MFGSPAGVAAGAEVGAINAIAATNPIKKRNPLFATESNGRIFRHISLIPLAPRKKFTSGVSGTKREDSLTVLIDFGYGPFHRRCRLGRPAPRREAMG